MANTFAGIPTIDLSGFLSGDPASTSSVVAAVRAAAISPGFFQVTGHGISPSQTQRVLDALHRFFALPQATKTALAKDVKTSVRGYEPLGIQHLEGDAPDRKEGIVWGSEKPAANLMARGPNKWAPEVECPGFRSEMMQFFDDGMVLSRALLRILALGLGLPETYFDALMEGENVIATCRAHRYLPRGGDGDGDGDAGATGKGARGVGAHTDWGALTLLMQDNIGGLEVFDRVSETWVPVPPARDALVVNLGDLMARWTNDIYSSTFHRVVSPAGEQYRYSVALFLMGDADYVIDCLPSCLEEGQGPKYEPITVGTHLLNKIYETYVV